MKWVQGQNSSQLLVFGKYKVGSVTYDGCTGASDPKKYRACCLLPGQAEHLGHYEFIDDARIKVQMAAQAWLENAGLQEK